VDTRLLTTTNNNHTVSRRQGGADVITSLKEVLLPPQGLGNDGKDSPEASRSDEVVILKLGCLCAVAGSAPRHERGDLADRVDVLNGAVDDTDVVGALVEGGDVLELDPCLLGVLLVCKGQGRTDQVDLMGIQSDVDHQVKSGL